MSDFPELTQAVIDGNRNKVIEIVNAELEKGVAPQSLLSDYMIPGMLEVGKRCFGDFRAAVGSRRRCAVSGLHCHWHRRWRYSRYRQKLSDHAA